MGVEGNFFQDEEKFKVLKNNASSDTYSEEEKPKHAAQKPSKSDPKNNDKNKKINKEPSKVIENQQ